MATSSIFANFDIKSKKEAEDFIEAICKSENYNYGKKNIEYEEIKDPLMIKQLWAKRKKQKESFSIINILDLIDNIGEHEVNNSISSFKCDRNKEIEEFIYNDAVDFAKRKISVTHLIFDDNSNIVGYFTLTHKPMRISTDYLSNTSKKKIERFAKLDDGLKSYDVSAFLIAQFGKSTSLSLSITGNDMMNMAISILLKVQRLVGGGIVFLECEDIDKLVNFYQNDSNRFVVYGNRISKKDNINYKQLLRLF